MKKFSYALPFFIALFFTIPQIQPYRRQVFNYIGIRPLGHTQYLNKLNTLIQEENWIKVHETITQGLCKSFISKQDIIKLSDQAPASPFAHAFQATQTILSLPEKTGLAFSNLFPIALFKETLLNNAVKKNEFYWPEKQFGRELQYDQETEKFFIHLGTHGVKKLGKGKYKVVTRSILYDEKEPRMLARGLSESKMRKERHAMKKTHGMPGVMQAEAFLKHRDPKTNKKMRAIMTPIYNLGSLKQMLSNKSFKLSFSEKVHLARDILSGLASLHSQGIAHRDLSTRNYFISHDSLSPEGCRFRVVIADLGRAMPIAEAKGVSAQGNTSFLAPEAFFRNRLSHEDYLATDIFAVGCVLWEIYTGSPPKWRKEKTFNKYILHPKKGANQLYTDILTTCKQLNLKLLHRTHKKYLDLVLQMVDPIPSKRKQASELKAGFDALTKDESLTYA